MKYIQIIILALVMFAVLYLASIRDKQLNELYDNCTPRIDIHDNLICN